MTPSHPPSVVAAVDHHTPTPKRRKPRSPHHADASMAHALDLHSSAWQTIVAFRTSFGKGFNRVLDGSFNLSTARKVVADKYQVDPETPMSLSYTAPDGMEIDLEDAEDFRAFQVYASRESVVTVNVDLDEASVGTHKPSETSPTTPSKPRARRGTRGKNGAAPQEPAPEPVPEPVPAPASEAAVTEASTTEKPVAPAAEAPPKESIRKRKPKAAKEKESEPSGETPAPPSPAPATAESDDDSDDMPLSHSAPPSSQSHPPPSQESVSDKPRRHRRTKAEMEVFRAEQAAKKLEREQARQNKASRPVAPEATADPSPEGDETTIVHEPRNDEHLVAASNAVQSLRDEGSAAMQQRLNDLKAKKQRKNAVEREEQKLLMGLIGKEAAGSDTTMRAYSPMSDD
ncbi:hypothetical protein MNAN1_001464 [Malassezia nana]|uniref:PB1 domain-containing protein n=1 Tax=Malassezia nana TaxID=180528 RepID=A0AAF0J1W5_9BASI|nr:hypothetical protein MNAN1_001464 [Malassezia nana]